MLPPGIYTGEVLSVNTLEYSVIVRVSQTYGINNSLPITATVLNIHGGYQGDTIGISMPEIGSLVMLLVPNGTSDSIAYIVGHVREPSARSPRNKYQSDLDPITDTIEPSGYFRGNGPDDLLPGDFVIKNSSGSRLDIDSSGSAKLSSSLANISVGTVGGNSYISSTANTFMASYDMLSVESTKETTLISANVSDSSNRNHYITDSNPKNDLFINIGGQSAFSINYKGNAEAAFSISKSGEILIRGSKVTIDDSGIVSGYDGIDVIKGNKGFNVEGKFSVSSAETSLTSSGNFIVSSGGNISTTASGDKVDSIGGILKTTVSGPSIFKQGPLALVPGLNDGMILQCESGSSILKAGSYLPGTQTLSKPQIRLEASSGGDVILQSQMSPGGAGVTGSIVISSPLPASVTGAGGLGNYGIVLNSPLCMLGNYPGVELTPPNIPNPFLPPIPLLGNEPVAKAVPLLATLTSLAAALTSFPPTAPVGAVFSASLGITAPLIPTRSVFAL